VQLQAMIRGRRLTGAKVADLHRERLVGDVVKRWCSTTTTTTKQ
jgi:hypothetical protein